MRRRTMRRLASVIVLATLVGGAASANQAGTIEPNLEAILSGARGQETVSVLVYLSERVDVDALDEQLDGGKATLRLRHEIVVNPG